MAPRLYALLFVLSLPACGTRTVSSTLTDEPDRAALLFGLGDYADATTSGGGCLGGGNFTAWPDGTTIHILASTTSLPEAHIAALEAAVSQIETVTGGRLTADVTRVADIAPQPSAGQITAYAVANPLLEGCPLPQGCAIASFSSSNVINTGKFVGAPGNYAAATVHDVIGHLALGLCHLSATYAGEDESLMSFGDGFTQDLLPEVLTARDLSAIQPAYAVATLGAGATPTDFTDAGLFTSEYLASLATIVRPREVRTRVLVHPISR